MTTLIIARHGNTFGPGDTPTRVGGRTDLPLVEKGEEQARAIGRYLKAHSLIPDVVYASHLQRTQQTARLAIRETGISNPVFTLDIFNEIDYGPDENKTEEEVIARIGAEAIQKWDSDAIVPEGWKADPEMIVKHWQDFADQIIKHCHPERSEGSHATEGNPSVAPLLQDGHEEVILVVTSNGIARFAPHITGDFEAFRAAHDIKLSTGALAIFEYRDGRWIVKAWNLKL